ncbi:hypothetical protein NLI96_g2447 [Meripilus lineatus]|uniref:Uncharacterized protein n=1 Tax=Meripilus lineatus TaxID=2056292 RepID=A0AAD5V8R8_9APHY|nr:hypothetical protein NLI96_g2447 [Physisporinus lineatus]
MAPLFIKVPLTAQCCSTNEVFDAFSRIRTIELNVKGIVDLNLEPRFPKEAPILQRIVFRNHEALQQEPDIILPGEENLCDSPIPGVFDHCPLPALTSLSIEGFTPDWRNHLFAPTLTDITVRITSENKYGTGCMFDALNQMKNLRLLDLTLECASLDWLTRQTRQVSLPKLEDLALHASMESCVYLFERLEFPPTTAVSVDILGAPRASLLLSSLFETVCSRLSVASAPRILTVALWDNDHIHTIEPRNHFAFWDQTIDTRVFRSSQPTVKPLFHIEITCVQDPLALLTMGISMGPVSNAHVLFIGTYVERFYHREDYGELLKESMPRVHTLHLRPPDMVTLERMCRVHKSEVTNETQPLFPCLHVLVLSELCFDRDSVWGLKRALRERKRSGHSIHTLELLQCETLESGDVDSFRKHVDEVLWQGEEGPSDDEDRRDDESRLLRGGLRGIRRRGFRRRGLKKKFVFS